MIKFRNIEADEIDLRVGSTNKDNTGFTLLLYKDARVDANILDETVGAENWQCKYYQVKNTMVCSVGININYADKNKDPLWIWKDDGGDDDYQAEKVKAELSDSFKRACFRWNIGRKNLYSSPFIWINVDSNNNKSCHYEVKHIAYNDKDEVKELVIINSKTKEQVFAYGVSNAKKEPTPNKNAKPNPTQINIDNTYLVELEKLGITLNQIADYLKKDVNELTNEEVRAIILRKEGKK